MANGLFDPSSIYNFLAQNNYLPKIVTANLNQGTSGSYAPGNIVKLSPNLQNYTEDAQQRTLAHEMTHSAQSLMADKAYELSNSYFLSPEEKQFLKAYQAFRTQPLLQEQDKEDKYRTGANERGAFGVGNMSVPIPADYATRKHVDPTEATQFDILMGLYKSSLSKQPQIENLKYQDPFKSTIK